MVFKTLEEKFLADFDKLQNENEELAKRVEELTEKIEQFNEKSRNITLDALVKAEGRKKVYDGAAKTWGVPDVGDRDFNTWCVAYTWEHQIPQGVSVQEFVDYFYEEYERAYEAKIAEEVAEGASEQ